MPIVEVKVPDIGDFKDVTVIEILVKVGDQIKEEQSLITVESDKASMEVPSIASGLVKEIQIKIGDKVNQGSTILLVETAQAAAAPAQEKPVKEASPEPKAAPAAPAPQSAPALAAAPVKQAVAASNATTSQPLVKHDPTAVQLDKLPHASPSIRKMARELGVPLTEVQGTGLKNRITVEDVQNFIARVMSGDTVTRAQYDRGLHAPMGSKSDGGGLDLLPWPTVNFEQFGEVERKPLSRIKKISGANLHRNWVMIPHVTNNEDADITELEAFRVELNKESEKAKANTRYSMLAFLIKACVAGLKQFPAFNTSLQGEELVYKKYFNIGFAADTPNGLVVPVIKNADQKGITEIAIEIAELAAKAREGKISPSEMSGGCFTISSLGGLGGTYFTPIVNAPEVAILGVCRSDMKPVWNGKEFEPRLILPMSLSYDHRVIDGALAARFNTYLSKALADFRRVLL